MGTVAVVVFIYVVQRDGLSPGCPAFELLMEDVDSSINDIDINTLASGLFKLVLAESTKAELGTVTDPGETLY